MLYSTHKTWRLRRGRVSVKPAGHAARR